MSRAQDDLMNRVVVFGFVTLFVVIGLMAEVIVIYGGR